MAVHSTESIVVSLLPSIHLQRVSSSYYQLHHCHSPVSPHAISALAMLLSSPIYKPVAQCAGILETTNRGLKSTKQNKKVIVSLNAEHVILSCEQVLCLRTGRGGGGGLNSSPHIYVTCNEQTHIRKSNMDSVY